jgi:hypothetical protein
MTLTRDEAIGLLSAQQLATQEIVRQLGGNLLPGEYATFALANGLLALTATIREYLESQDSDGLPH